MLWLVFSILNLRVNIIPTILYFLLCRLSKTESFLPGTRESGSNEHNIREIARCEMKGKLVPRRLLQYFLVLLLLHYLLLNFDT